MEVIEYLWNENQRLEEQLRQTEKKLFESETRNAQLESNTSATSSISTAPQPMSPTARESIDPVCSPRTPLSTDNDQLLPVEEVLSRYKHLIKKKSFGNLTCKLAQFSIFGEDLLRQRTPLGKGRDNLPALPEERMARLKEVLLEVMGYRAEEMEKQWKNCVRSLEHLCKRLRKKQQ